MGLVDRKVVTHSSFLDLFLLAESDFFIGTLSSAFRSRDMVCNGFDSLLAHQPSRRQPARHLCMTCRWTVVMFCIRAVPQRLS